MAYGLYADHSCCGRVAVVVPEADGRMARSRQAVAVSAVAAADPSLSECLHHPDPKNDELVWVIDRTPTKATRVGKGQTRTAKKRSGPGELKPN